MAKSLHKELAAALEISTDDILMYRPTEDGYNVITKDYRKFSDVQPLIIEPEPDDTDPGGAEEPGQTDPGPAAGSSPPGMPKELIPVFEQPSIHLRPQIVALAHYLEIPRAVKLSKKNLIIKINEWKKENGYA